MWLSHEYEYSKAAWNMTEWFLPKFTLITYWFFHLFNISILLRRPRPKLELKKFFSSGITGKTLRVILQCQSQWGERLEIELCIQINNGNAICHTLHFDVPFSYPAKGKACPASCRQVKNAAMLENDSAWNERMQMKMKTPLGGAGRKAVRERRSSLDKYAESATALRLRRVQINTDPGRGEVVPWYVLMTQQLKRKLY